MIFATLGKHAYRTKAQHANLTMLSDQTNEKFFQTVQLQTLWKKGQHNSTSLWLESSFLCLNTALTSSDPKRLRLFWDSVTDRIITLLQGLTYNVCML